VEHGPEPANLTAFVWKDHSRFVEVRAVYTGWLVVWGRYADFGSIRTTEGSAVYGAVSDARRRVADAAMDITGSRASASEASQMFDLFPFPEHTGNL
jgi:hypothetical protein